MNGLKEFEIADEFLDNPNEDSFSALFLIRLKWFSRRRRDLP